MKRAALILFCLALFLPVFALDKDAANYYDDLRPAGATGNQSSTHLSAKKYDSSYFYDSGCKNGMAGNFDGAIKDFTKAIKLNPKHRDAYDFRGTMYANKNDFTAANADWSKALEIDPKFARAYMNRAMGRKAIGDTDGAIEDLSAANKLGINEALVIRSEILTNGYADPKQAAAGGFVFHNEKGYYVLPKGGLEIQGTVVTVIDGFNIVIKDILENNYHICLGGMEYPGPKSSGFKKAKAFTAQYCLGKAVIARTPPQEKKDCLKGAVAVLDVKTTLNDALINAKLAKKKKSE